MAARNDLPVKPGQGHHLNWAPACPGLLPTLAPGIAPAPHCRVLCLCFPELVLGPGFGTLAQLPSPLAWLRAKATGHWDLSTQCCPPSHPCSPNPQERLHPLLQPQATPTPQALQLALPWTSHSSVYNSPSMGPTCLPRAPYGHCVTQAPSALGSVPCLSCPPTQKGERNCDYVGC